MNVKNGRYKLGFAVLALFMLVTAIGAPLAAQGSVGERQLVHIQHEGHCHLVSDCDATAFAGHPAPALPDSVVLSPGSELSRPVALQEFAFGSFFEPVPTPPPIA